MKRYSLAAILLAAVTSHAQVVPDLPIGSVTGNVQSVFQYYNEDTLINAANPPERMGMNTFGNINWNFWKVSAGVRFESYLPALAGYPPRFSGTGIGYRYAKYNGDDLEVTLGNFYEQFGSGMIFRTYEERNLGYDNAMDGIRLVYRPYKGITIKGVYGKQRMDFNGRQIHGEGIVRGFDGEVNFASIFQTLQDKKLKAVVGGSFISKYQEDRNPTLILPENVGSYGGRLGLGYKNFYLEGEYVHKENDPSADNGYNYKPGYGIYITGTYSRKGLGVSLQAKSIDNMSFRSNRDMGNQDLLINYMPALTKQHTYNLAATLYPYATVPTGEVAYQADVIYTIPKKTKLGGKYGTTISLNFSTAYDIFRDSVRADFVGGFDSTRNFYTSDPFSLTRKKFFQDFNIEIKRKFNKWFKATLAYYNLHLNTAVTGVTSKKEMVYSHIGVLDMTFKINRKHAIRTELQALFTEQDKGNWATGVIEYTVSPHWYVAVMDQWNYGNEDANKRVHYLMGSAGYIHGSMRFSASYGRQREGLFCIGGICRTVPASNALTLTFSTSF